MGDGMGRGSHGFLLLLYSVPTLGFSILVGLFLHFSRLRTLDPFRLPPLTGYNQIISPVT